MTDYFTPKVFSRQDTTIPDGTRCTCGAILRSWFWTRQRGSRDAWRAVRKCETCKRVVKL